MHFKVLLGRQHMSLLAFCHTVKACVIHAACDLAEGLTCFQGIDQACPSCTYVLELCCSPRSACLSILA